MKAKANNKLQRSYVSDITKLLNSMSENNPKTEAQRQEIEKAARITEKMSK
ncbi:CBU_0585 family protein [Piscirickettsia litoralis]|uniref:CBU_0585 family protein n=1 Tax=Piscirickettsia litoralis TaxID=1891921 RepID=UPI0013903AF9|nr:CBU_0585 family protein [Piscirickettsia litoralis]